MTPPKTALVSPEKPPFDVDEALKTIVAYEGFRPGAYADTKGLQTIGYGTLIGDGSEEDYQKSPYFNKPISEKEALKIARRDLLTRLPRVVSLVGGRFFNMAPETQREIVASFYRGGITGSPKTLKLIRAGKFKEASVEFLNNDEYRAAAKPNSGARGVAIRMKNLSVALASEEPKEASFEEAVETRINQ